jgi:hypothetical protein
MARVDKLPPLHVLESVAIQAANALANTAHSSAKSDEADASLHESFPIWLMTGLELQRLRAEPNTAIADIRRYMRKTQFWLHLLYRNRQPFGYVHGKHRPKDWHKVTNVSVTREAILIRQAIDQVDLVSTDEDDKAGLFECPTVGLAGIILFPKRRKDELRICLFRDPHAPADWAPTSLITGTGLIERLLQLHVVTGPGYEKGK